MGYLRVAVYLLLLTVAAIAIHGYHLGIEDQAIYLPAIRFDLDHGLYPHDSEFFLPQTRPTLIDELVASTVRARHISVEQAVFGWHIVSIFLILLGCWRVSKILFPGEKARWAAVSLIAGLLTIPVTGTALYLADQHLHPRALATAFILFATCELLPSLAGQRPGARRWALAAMWVTLATVIHIQMAFFGTLLLIFIVFPWRLIFPWERVAMAALIGTPLHTLFQPGSAEWREAAMTRSQHYLLRWEWYEWVGIFAPMAMLWGLSILARKIESPGFQSQIVGRLCRRLAYLAIVAFVGAVIITTPARFERLTPYQPMRAFHLIYLSLFLIIGGLLGHYVLKNKVWRWLALFLSLAAGMFYAQRDLFPATRHIEWPGATTGNQWVDAFDWVRLHTPTDSFFVLDPHYISYPGEDYHGFRGLAERGQMADRDKDPGVVCLFPAIAHTWHEQVTALDGFPEFTAADFHRLHQQFGVDWAVLAKPGGTKLDSEHRPTASAVISSLECPYQNRSVAVCRIR